MLSVIQFVKQTVLRTYVNNILLRVVNEIDITKQDHGAWIWFALRYWSMTAGAAIIQLFLLEVQTYDYQAFRAIDADKKPKDY